MKEQVKNIFYTIINRYAENLMLYLSIVNLGQKFLMIDGQHIKKKTEHLYTIL